MKGIRVTVEDLETGESDSVVIADDYVLMCAGSCHLAHTQTFPSSGTHVLTVKGRRTAPVPSSPAVDPDREDA